jgi:hypothetical protein
VYALENEAIKDITEYFITGSRHKKAKLFIPGSVPKAVLYYEAVGLQMRFSCCPFHQARTIGVPHFGHFCSEHGMPC